MANRWYHSLCRTFCRCYDPLNDAYGFVGDHALNAPQANAMAAIIEPMMTGGSAQWPLYMAGALFAIILWMVKVPPIGICTWYVLANGNQHTITYRWSDCILRTK